MTRIDVPREVLSFVQKEGTYLIVTHIDPDGDCLGSSLALGHFLERLGHTVVHLNPGPFDRQEIVDLAPLFSEEVPAAIADRVASGELPPFRAVVLDVSTLERTGACEKAIAGIPTAIIDHHSSGEPFGEARYVDTTSPSTSFLVQRTIEALGMEPDEYEAGQLLFALATDSGYFRFLEGDSGDVFESVGRLVRAGASPAATYYRMNGGRSLASRRYLGMLLSRVEDYLDGRLLVSAQTLEDARNHGDDVRDSAAMYQLLMTTADCIGIISLRAVDENSCTGSLRSTVAIDVGKLAAEYGGGGHARAAGFLAHEPIEAIKPRIIADFIRLIGNYLSDRK